MTRADTKYAERVERVIAALFVVVVAAIAAGLFD